MPSANPSARIAESVRGPVESPAPETAPRWLLLIHQLPRTPGYLRAKVGRQLARVGAVAVKNSVYVLPNDDGTREDFQWIATEIESAGAEVSIFEASVVDGISDRVLEDRFRVAVAPAWDDVAREASALAKTAARSKRAAQEARDALPRLRKRAAELTAIDFFGSPAARAAALALAACERTLGGPSANPALAPVDRSTLCARSWVTRKGVKVDRIASAWLVRQFIDRDATFLFVAKPDDAFADPQPLRFDMPGGAFTHEGDLCTFEVLAIRADVADPAVRAIAEIVHDLDIKDGRYARSETAGVAAMIAGLCANHPRDEDRLRVGGELFDALYSHFRPAAGPLARVVAPTRTSGSRSHRGGS